MFVSTEEFKALHMVSSLGLRRNKETGKLFVDVGGSCMKMQQDFDKNKPATILVEAGGDPSNLDHCCLINYDPSKGAEDLGSI